MSIYLRGIGILLICAFMGLLVAGCTYHTYYEGAPEGSYELKESVPVSKEHVVEHHYVVE